MVVRVLEVQIRNNSFTEVSYRGTPSGIIRPGSSVVLDSEVDITLSNSVGRNISAITLKDGDLTIDKGTDNSPGNLVVTVTLRDI